MAIVFRDAYTTGADTNIDAYPAAGADYAYNKGSGSDLTVNAANDRVQVGNAAVDNYFSRIIDGAVPTGNQEIEIHGLNIAADSFSAFPAARMATSGNLENLYKLNFTDNVANEVELYRWDDGVETLIASADRAMSGAAVRRYRLKVTGAGATVDIEGQIGFTPSVTFADTSGSRKTSGVPGVGIGAASGNALWLDDITVDDLLASGNERGGSAQHIRHTTRRSIAGTIQSGPGIVG